MGRSGTSVVTHALRASGWALMEDRLIRGNWRNPKGFFEDKQINSLHNAMLADHGVEWNDVDGLRALRGRRLAIAKKRMPRVRRMIDEYRSDGPWAWKNPRATIFLHAWATLLPEATFVICLRHPAGVASSLRRGKNPLGEPNWDSWRYLKRALSIWESYNTFALDFARANPERVVIVRIPEDAPLITRLTDDVFSAQLMTPPTRREALAYRLTPSCQLLYKRLERLHDPRRVEALLQGPTTSGPGPV